MRKTEAGLLFSPTDLARFMTNPYVTWMDRLHLGRPGTLTPDEDTEEQKIIAGKGMEHERSFLDALRNEGRDICEIPTDRDARDSLTLDAFSAGREVIYQGILSHDAFSGIADFLVRVDRPSRFGDFGYEVWDTKLSRETKPHFLIQLSCYAEILEALQGWRPEELTVVLGTGEHARYRTDDYFFYYRALKEAFLAQQRAFDRGAPPEPLREGRNGRWESVAQKWMQENDHLSLVASIRKDQIQRLRKAGVSTVAELAKAPARVPRMQPETLDKLRNQARLQIASRGLARPRVEILTPVPQVPRRGLAILPPPSRLDVAFDIEGYPLIEGGLEYLLGVIVAENKRLEFHDWWAHDPAQEKASFERFVDWVMDRWRRDPAMHVYHYAAYEVTALRRLMGKYGTRENEVDDLLRQEVFVDLYQVVRQGLRIGIPSYSLKKVESLYLDSRKADVATAAQSIVFYQRWLDEPDGETYETSKILREIRDYNEEDCVSTWKLLEWLRDQQSGAAISYVPRTNPDEKKATEQEEPSGSILARELLEKIPEDRSGDPERWRVHELLAHLLGFHRRESKPVWWRLFDRHDASEEALWDDLDCLAGLVRTGDPPRAVKRSTAFQYTFDPRQDTKVRQGSSCYSAHDLDIKCSVESFDPDGKIEIKLGPKALERLEESRADGADGTDTADVAPKRLTLIPDEWVSPKPIEDSIERVVSAFSETAKLPPHLADFLYRRRPKIKSRPDGPIIRDHARLSEEALEAVRTMQGTTLCIQGPPGTGKTHTGAEIILALIRAGCRVGVSTNSHKAICNLMGRVVEEAETRGDSIRVVKVGGKKTDPLMDHDCVSHEQSVKKVEGPFDLYGGTAWTFSAPEAVGLLDYLFIDEAGQVAVANLVGMSPSTKNIVLLGDQMQLGQPTQGSHPGESGTSVLDYLLQDHATIPDDLGIFLDTSWRMHPDVCEFISESIYEGRLTSKDHTANRRLILGGGSPGGGGGDGDGGGGGGGGREAMIDRTAGIQFVPVAHEGNRQGSEEEVEAIQRLVAELLRCRHTNAKGRDVGELTLENILVVAPYNYQVRMLKRSLGEESRVGTIDKFQGQQAPVVIVSMAASAGDVSSRGIEFLFDRNRLNVAISRAQSLAVVVGNPGLARTACSSVKQMGLVNLFCRVVDTARSQAPDTAPPSAAADATGSTPVKAV